MPETDIGATDVSDFKGTQGDFKVDSQETDGPFDQPESEWTNEKWTQYLGYYKTIPELKVAIDAKATWTVGKGFTSDPVTSMLLESIKGWGKDTFNTILENMIRTYYIGGDSYCEIILDKNDFLLNLKSLDPGTITHITNRQGVIIRYEQRSKVKAPVKKFRPDQIFHLARNRVADEIHGQSIITALEPLILARNEALDDWKIVMHRNVDPVRIWHLDTDDPGKISAFIKQVESRQKNKENIFTTKGAVEIEQANVAPNSTLNPLPWIEALNNYFFQAVGVPQIIVGGTGAITEAAVKIAYLAFQQTIEEEQLFIEENVLSQLNLEINLEFPASLENELLSDKAKDGPENIDANDTTAGSGQ